ncbi:methyltransferase domain-containing protein [Paenibacillus sacheonensis]|uniref:Methyltransferase domain-containing protein n=1 Tax=Paenibacillus sacheonensis TaxID=742054 RepID=A0A7X4YRI1_9BACL|nr:putative AdoMet-dependent methyltransferase [Paenibacillus sacheonensis]NBC71183.1 methyltransferase domain-containing protein [Paenibacillus sacheonensis]
MKINEIAERLAITPRAIRLYETKGLLKPGREAKNGYRIFSESDAWRLQTIAALRSVGLGLDRIKTLIERHDEGDSATVHHDLELQRMALVSKWVESKYAIAMLDELIGRLEAKGKLEPEDLLQLTGRLKEVRRQQESWIDAWQFDKLAAEFDGSSAWMSAGAALSQAEYEQVLDLIMQWVSPQEGEEGLDIGTGTGNLAGLLAAGGARMSGVDQSREMLSLCRDKHPSVTAKLGNALALPFADGRFPFVVSAFALHYMSGGQQLLALEEMDRVLKPHGRICLAGLMRDNGLGAGESDPTRHAIDRSELTAWFRERGYITLHYSINTSIGALYAVRKH